MSEKVQEFISKEVKEWAEFITYRLARELASKREITVSRKEIFDIQRAVLTALRGNVQEVDFRFADAGRFIDMKKIRYRGSGQAERGKEFIEVLEDWVRRQGVSSFEFVPNYERGRAPLRESDAVTRIALGIFFHKMRDSNTHKRKKWWSHIFYGGLGNLYGRLMYNYGVAAADAIKEVERVGNRE